MNRLVTRLVGTMLQISIIFYSKFLLKCLHYALFYSFYANDFIILNLQVNY